MPDRKSYILLLKGSLIAFFLLSMQIHDAVAQYYSSGQEPASTRWRSIRTATHRLIYPGFFEKEAQRAAAILEYTALNDSFTLKPRFRPVDVVMHPLTTYSNAVVPWAPARIDYYPVPPQDSYPQDWFEQLAIHEHRHVLQYNSMKRGFGKFLYYLTGQQSSALLLGMFVPFWAIEGDAVSAETALSLTGRGRLPSFEMPLKAQLLKKGIYSYDKACFGSYKNFVPDHYILGYHLIASGLISYGNQFLDKTLRNTAKYPFLVVPFSEGIRKQTTLNKTGFYNETLNRLTDRWMQEAMSNKMDSSILNCKTTSRLHTNFRKPSIGKDRVFTLKKTLDEVDQIVEVFENKPEEVIITPGYIHSESLTVSKNLLAWAEYRYDPRWQNRDFSVIRIYDINTRMSRYLTHKTRYFSPALSPDARQVVVVEVTVDNRYSLKIIDVVSGQVVDSLNTAENYFLMTPAWSDDGKSLVVTALGKEGKAFLLFDKAGHYRQVMPFSHSEISRPVLKGIWIYFGAAYSGVDEIYRVNIQTQDIERVTFSKYGAFDPTASEDGSRLYFSEYTPDGYRVAMKKLNETKPEPFLPAEQKTPFLAETLAKNPGRVFDFREVDHKTYPSSEYTKWKQLLNFHSWGPFSLNAENLDFSPGISVLSQDVLNTSFLNAGYTYDLNHETGKWYARYSYEGFYPVFDFSVDYGPEKGLARKIDTINQQIVTSVIPVEWNETNLKSSVRVPLFFSYGQWRQNIQPAVGYTYSRLNISNDPGLEFTKNIIKSFENELIVSNQIKSTPWDRFPRWGQSLRLYYRTTPLNFEWDAYLWAVYGTLYFPGVGKHHGLRLNFGYQERDKNGLIFSSYLSYPRGFTDQFSDQLIKLSADYWLPVYYPDVSLSSLAYIKRISAGLFYDYAFASLMETNKELQSAGLDLNFNVNLLRFFAPLELGLRTIYRPDYQDIQFMFLYSVNFSLF